MFFFFQVWATVPSATRGDVEEAVTTAHAAFNSWAATSMSTRLDMISDLASALRARKDVMGEALCLEQGVCC